MGAELPTPAAVGALQAGTGPVKCPFAMQARRQGCRHVGQGSLCVLHLLDVVGPDVIGPDVIGKHVIGKDVIANVPRDLTRVS
jgi:hypothetical protein